MLLAFRAFQLWVEIQQTAEMHIPLPLIISIKKGRQKNDIELPDFMPSGSLALPDFRGHFKIPHCGERWYKTDWQWFVRITIAKYRGKRQCRVLYFNQSGSCAKGGKECLFRHV